MARKKKKSTTKHSPSGDSIIQTKVIKLFMLKRHKELSFKRVFKELEGSVSKDRAAQAIQFLVQKEKLSITSTGKLILGKKTSGSQKLYEGVVDATRAGHAYIITNEFDSDIFVLNHFLNTALHGDRVKVSIFKKSKRRVEGRVEHIVERNTSEFVGVFQQVGEYGFVIPKNQNITVDIFVPHNKINKAKDGDKVVARIDVWMQGNKNPEGTIVEVIEGVNESDEEMKMILVENGFPLSFSKKALQAAEDIDESITQKEIDKRRDFREVQTFTIDPIDAKDFDDALSYVELDNGNIEVGIHIADVSHYVLPDSDLDKEAKERATSVYLVDRVLPMLPEKLSNKVCSLRPKEEKLCFAAVFELGSSGKVENEWFGRTIIYSDHRFTYESAQKNMDSGNGKFAKELGKLNQIAKKLRSERMRAGAINFDSIEYRFELDDNAVPIKMYVKERFDAHKLIEEFMLLANKRVSMFLSKDTKNWQGLAVYRNHDWPDMDKLGNLSMMAHKMGYKLNLHEPNKIAFSINKLMESSKEKPEYFVFEQLAMRAMSKAYYGTNNIGHYGLSFEYYSHFTSPIRRYPDVMLHRLLQQRLDEDMPSGNSKSLIEKDCKHSSKMERQAMDAERESVKYKQVEFMNKHIGKTFEGTVVGIISSGIFVELTELKIEGKVPSTTIGDGDVRYDERNLQLVDLTTGTTYSFGDDVTVSVVKTDLERRQIELALVD